MKTSEHLFYLIQSLSKSEKRSFKLFAKQHTKNENNNYTILFDAIDKMPVYDHSELIKKLEGKIITKHISTLKVQLNELILKSLRNNPQTGKINVEIRQNIDFIELLFEKGLYSQCKKLVSKTIELAQHSENYLALDHLSIWEFKIALKESNTEDLTHYINETYPKVKEARKINDILAEFEHLSIQMRLLSLESTSMSGKLTNERFNPIIKHPIMNLDIDQYPLQCQIDFHTIWGHYHYAVANQKETYFHRKKVLDLIEKSTIGERTWLTHARLLLTSLSTFKLFEEFDKELAHIQSVIQSTPKQRRSSTYESELEMTLQNIRFHRDLDAGHFSQIKTYIKELEELYEYGIHRIDTNLQMAFSFNLAYAYLGLKEYKKSLNWINSLLNNPKMKNLRMDIQGFTRIMNICVHYSLENYDLIGSIIKSTERFLKKENRLYDLEYSFLKFANRHLTSPYSKHMKASFDEQCNNWEELAKTPQGSMSIEYIDLISWVRSISKHSTMEEVSTLSK